MTVLYIAIALFALAAVFGLTILVKWISKSKAPNAVVYTHGVLAASGLALVIAAAVRNPDHWPKASLVLFAIAAVAGFFMFFTKGNDKMGPVALAFLHGAVAVAGFAGLLIFVFA